MKLKVGIVEDDLIIAESIAEMLDECGYEVAGPAIRYSEAIRMIEEDAPDLLLLDVNIPGKMDGIDLANTVQKAFGIPFIFLTANTDFSTIERAKEVVPAAFLAKPVTRAQLFAAIEIAVSAPRPATMSTPAAPQQAAPTHLFLNDGRAFLKVIPGDILFVESEENYLRIYLADGSTPLVRMTMTAFEEKLGAARFARVHRCYIVALDRVTKALREEVRVGDHKVPVSKTYREPLMQALGIRP